MTRLILVLRPEPGNTETRRRLDAVNLENFGIPLFEVTPRQWQAPDPADFTGVLITSANAIRHGGPKLDALRALPVHAVGKSSAQAAEAAGFQIATIGESDVKALVSGLRPAENLLHLRGADAIAVDGLESRIVYESVAVVSPVGLPGLLDRRPVVLLHSARAADRFGRLVGTGRDRVALAAISANAAASAGEGWESVAIAREPRDEALVELAALLARD